MKQVDVNVFFFIKLHNSLAVIKYSQPISTSVSLLNQFGFTRELSSQSVLNTADRKLPPVLKTN